MDYANLPTNSENILNKLVKADNPTQLLCDYFDKVSQKEDEELRGILKELRIEGYINVNWAGDKPYLVTLNNSARTYNERRAKHGAPELKQRSSGENIERTIFISHRSTDKEIANMLTDFFCGTGIPKEKIFCSSLPGNDINRKISSEIKSALTNSVINIAILSKDYYQSAYCLNEAGVLWYKDDITVIPIALPEINENNMYGFLNSEFKLRRLNEETDVTSIYDMVQKAVSATQSEMTIVLRELQKLKDRYNRYLQSREQNYEVDCAIADLDLTTDDERIVLYYILENKVRKIKKNDVIEWLHKKEIYNVNVDNAFDLLSSFDDSKVINDTLELGIKKFKEYSANADKLITTFQPYIEVHMKLAADTFKELWESDTTDSILVLFVAYIIENKTNCFGARWMAEGEIENIKQWEYKNSLESILSNNYGRCLETFIQHDLVYESSWTSYGNPRAYTLCPSLQELLFNCSENYIERVNSLKLKYSLDRPF